MGAVRFTDTVVESHRTDRCLYSDTETKTGIGLEAIMLLETGDVKVGIEHLEKAIQSDPNNLEVHLALAKAYTQSGRNEDARRERAECLQLTKNSTTPSFARP